MKYVFKRVKHMKEYGEWYECTDVTPTFPYDAYSFFLKDFDAWMRRVVFNDKLHNKI